MSIEIMSLVWKRSPERGASLLVQLALADWANDEGWSYPSIATLSFKARTSRRGAQKILKGLVERGMVEKVRGNSRKSSRYRIRVENLTEVRQKPTVEKPQQIEDLGGEPGSPQGRTEFATGGEHSSPGGANVVRRGGEPSSPLVANPVRLWGEPGSPNPSSDTPVNPSVKPGEAGRPPGMTTVEWMQEVERRREAEKVELAAAPVVVLKEPRTSMLAWNQLLAFWRGEFDRPLPEPARQLPQRTVAAWGAIGGAARFQSWKTKPGDMGFALRDFREAWEGLAETEKSDKVMMR